MNRLKKIAAAVAAIMALSCALTNMVGINAAEGDEELLEESGAVSPAWEKGDVNGDDKLNEEDIKEYINYLTGITDSFTSQEDGIGDIDQDGAVTIADAAWLWDHILYDSNYTAENAVISVEKGNIYPTSPVEPGTPFEAHFYVYATDDNNGGPICGISGDIYVNGVPITESDIIQGDITFDTSAGVYNPDNGRFAGLSNVSPFAYLYLTLELPENPETDTYIITLENIAVVDSCGNYCTNIKKESIDVKVEGWEATTTEPVEPPTEPSEPEDPSEETTITESAEDPSEETTVAETVVDPTEPEEDPSESVETATTYEEATTMTTDATTVAATDVVDPTEPEEETEMPTEAPEETAPNTDVTSDDAQYETTSATEAATAVVDPTEPEEETAVSTDIEYGTTVVTSDDIAYETTFATEAATAVVDPTEPEEETAVSTDTQYDGTTVVTSNDIAYETTFATEDGTADVAGTTEPSESSDGPVSGTTMTTYVTSDDVAYETTGATEVQYPTDGTEPMETDVPEEPVSPEETVMTTAAAPAETTTVTETVTEPAGDEELPQTGRNSAKNLLGFGGAVSLSTLGFWAVTKSGVLRKKKDEE